jgi:hypothetical protein
MFKNRDLKLTKTIMSDIKKDKLGVFILATYENINKNKNKRRIILIQKNEFLN